MEENKDAGPKPDSKEPNIEESPNDEIQSLTQTINKLSAELETVKENVQKRKSENTTLKVLFYTGLVVLLGGFLYSNAVLQRAHMRSLERNIISLEQRILLDMDQIKMDLERDVQDLDRKLRSIYGTDIFTILNRMDLAITQIHPKKERTAMLINRVRLHADEFNRSLRDQMSRSKIQQSLE